WSAWTIFAVWSNGLIVLQLAVIWGTALLLARKFGGASVWGTGSGAAGAPALAAPVGPPVASPQPDENLSAPAMSFFGAIGSVFSKYAQFRGRASLSEFWYFVMFFWIVVIAGMSANDMLSVPSSPS